MNSIDLKIFELMEILKKLGTIKYDKDFAEAVGVLTQNLSRIKQGKAHFTTEHVKNMCDAYNINANCVFGEEKKIFNTVKPHKNKALQD